MKEVLLVATLACTVVGLNAISPQTKQLISDYSWYEDVEHYARDLWPDSIKNYAIRATIARYLEHQGMYDAGDTENCKDVDEYHNKFLDTCFAGKAQQNSGLIETLKSKEVQAHLSSVSAWEIVNGKEGVFLKDLREIADRLCSRKKQWCDWFEFVKRHEEVPRGLFTSQKEGVLPLLFSF